MNIKLIFKFVLDALFQMWIFCFALTVLCFLLSLVSKIVNPDTKNLEWNSLTILGVFLLVFSVINILALKRRARNKKLN
ncbi:hypothetical protein [Lacinutrix sp.]|uniref:hypothetical protein n=1 Tax=Lacinutrix sp. TaxID=1937692 RepID=UPI0025BCBA52|nr:hypothetical protein [Lacinutrix sp.]